MAEQDGATSRPYRKVGNTRPGEVRWTRGFWAARFALLRDVTLPSMWETMHTPGNAALFENLYVAAGLREGAHQGTDWSDGDCYKWMEAASQVYGVTGEPALDAQLDELIDVIARAQAPDGYICTQIQLRPERKRWQLRRHHELYNMGHLMTAASVHHTVTGKDSFLRVACKVADYLYSVFRPRPPELAHFGWNPSQIMGLVDLHRVTGERRYLELADIFVDMRGSRPQDFVRQGDTMIWDGGDQNQDRVPLRQEVVAVGHAVTATYLYAGAADVYAETGDPLLLEALERIWRDVTERKMYVTGGVGALHNGSSVRHDPVHEAFGMAYQLPNATAYNETCANIGNAMWNWRMLGITGDARYADIMEFVLYNSGLSPWSLDGRRFFYTNPLRWHGKEHRLLSNDAHERWFTHTCYCCPPQVARTVAGLHHWAYGLSADGVWIHLYGGSHLHTTLSDGASLALTQETAYPWEGLVRITIEEAPPRPLVIRLRIPGWAEGAEITVGGRDAHVVARPGAYVGMERRWRPGDTIKLILPMTARLMRAHPLVEETRNQAAVMRGPVVYCLESADLPEGVRVAEVHLPHQTHLTSRHEPSLLGGITILQGEARRIHAAGSRVGLYGDTKGEAIDRLPITLIPYYAWNNRGITEMSVWLPLV